MDARVHANMDGRVDANGATHTQNADPGPSKTRTSAQTPTPPRTEARTHPGRTRNDRPGPHTAQNQPREDGPVISPEEPQAARTSTYLVPVPARYRYSTGPYETRCALRPIGVHSHCSTAAAQSQRSLCASTLCRTCLSSNLRSCH